MSASQELQAHKERAENKLFIQQATKKISKSKKIIAATIIVACAITISLSFIAQNQKYNAKVSQINANAIQAKQTFELGQELKGLQQAIQGVKQFKKIVKNQNNLAKHPANKPLKIFNEILNNLQQKNQIELNNQGIASIAYSPDNQTIIAGSNDGKLQLWNTQDNEIKIFNELPKKITKIVVSSDGKTILFSDLEGSIQISDSEGNLTDILKAENVTSFSLSPDEKYIVAGDNQGNLTLWTKDGKLLKTWQVHQGNITDIAFSPDNQTIVSSSDDTALALSTISGKKITTLTKHRSIVNSVAFSPDGKIIASGSADNTIKLWTATGELIKDIAVNSQVNSVAFSTDGQTLISGNSDKTIKLWNINPDSRKETGTLRDTLIGHQNKVTTVIYSPDGENIISGDEDGIVKLWQNPFNKTRIIEVGILSPDGKTLIFSNRSANITFQSLDGEIIQTLPPLENTIITSIALTPNRALAGTIDGKIAEIDLSQNTEATWQFLNQASDKIRDEYYQGEVIALDFHPSGDGFISVGIERQDNDPKPKLFVIKLWDQQGNLETTVNPGDKEAITALRFMPQGNEFIIARTNGEIELWQIDGVTKKIVARNASQNSQENLTSIAISSDGNILATANKDGTIQVRKMDGTLLFNFDSEISQIKNIYFSQDNKTLLVIKSNGTISSWTMDIDALLQRGCQWLEEYSRSTKDFPQELCLFDS